MFITDIVTYGIESHDFSKKYEKVLSDIQITLEKLDRKSIAKYRSRRGPMFSGEDKDEVTSWKMKRLWEEVIFEEGWEESRSYIESEAGRRFSTRMLGFLNGKISCSMSTHREHLTRWLYSVTPMAYRNGLVDIPIMIIPTKNAYEVFFQNKFAMREEFERVVSELHELSPLSHSHPFALVGIAAEEEAINYQTLASEKGINSEKVILDKSIEFPPEFRQAGLGILNYFGEIVREKYPDTNAKIRIEQDGTKVRMVIEADDGSREVIEKALEEYELVVTGKIPPEEIFENKAKLLELKNELRIAEARIESQRDIIEYQKEDIKDLKQLFKASLLSNSSSGVNLTVSPNINISSSYSTSLSVVCGLNEALDDIQFLLESRSSDPEMSFRLNDLYEAVDNVDQNASAEVVRSSAGLNKLYKFLTESNEVGAKANEFIGNISNGVDVVKSLAKKYNSVAEWCGAPQIPNIFTN